MQARILARQYKELPASEQKKWEKKAEQDKMRYQEEMKHYIPAEDPTGGKSKKKKKVRATLRLMRVEWASGNVLTLFSRGILMLLSAQ